VTVMFSPVKCDSTIGDISYVISVVIFDGRASAFSAVLLWRHCKM